MDVAHHCAATATTTAANGPFLLHGCSHSNKYQYQHRETQLRVLKLNDDGRKATQKEWTKQRVRLLFFCYSQCYRCCWCCCCLPLFFAIFVWFAIRACTLLFRSDSYTLAMPCNAICWCFSVDVVCASWCYLNFSFVSWIYYCFCLLSMLQCIGQCQPLEFSGECECIRDVFFFLYVYIFRKIVVLLLKTWYCNRRHYGHYSHFSLFAAPVASTTTAYVIPLFIRVFILHHFYLQQWFMSWTIL